MNWKNRLTNYNFWVSIVSAVILILQALNIEFDFMYVNEVVTAVLGLLVVIGIINDPTKSASSKKTDVDTKVEDSKNEQENLQNSEKEPENTQNINDLTLKNEKTENFEQNIQIQPEINNAVTNKEITALPNIEENEIVNDDIQNNLPSNEININTNSNEGSVDTVEDQNNEPTFFNIVN